MDPGSDYVYVHLMRDLSLSETLLDRKALEKLITQAKRTIKHYQADNSRFTDHGFIDSINQKYQDINFLGVGVHHQNGKVENKNKILTTSERTLLPHGIIMWQQMIDEMFWKFSMKAIYERLNSLQIYHKGRTTKFILHGFNV